MKLKALAIATAMTLLLTACSTGTSESPEAPTDEAASPSEPAAATPTSAGVPEVVQPLEVRDLVRSTLEGKHIAFIPLLYSGFKITEQWGTHMERAFTNLGAEFSVHDANFDTDQMVRIIDELIRSGDVDVLVLHNPDLNVLSQQIRDAADAGIYTIVLNMISNQSGDVFIGADLVSIAQDITRRAAEDCESRGKNKIALINGPATDPWNVQYAEGVNRAAEETGLEIVDTTDSQWQADLAAQQAATLLERHGDDLCALMLPWDVIAIPAAEAVGNAEREGVISEDAVGVYAVDASSDGCDAVRDGRIRATVSYDQPGIGTGAVIAVQQLLELGLPPGSHRTVSYVPHVVLDQSNLDDVAQACYTGS
jgi:ribose transport system substrate-binding protein